MAITAGNAENEIIDSKHVINRELWAAMQFPIGDDVSAPTPAAKQRRSPFEHADTEQERGMSSAVPPRGRT
jgi:hypothetical protein